jgi:Ca2+-binding RTX toxin-like protein
MVATIPTAQGVNFVVGGSLVTEVRGFLDRLVPNTAWQAQLTAMVAAGRTTVVISDDQNDLPQGTIRSLLYNAVYSPVSEVGGAEWDSPTVPGFAWILLNQQDGIWTNGVARDRFTIFVHEVSHITGPSGAQAHGGVFTNTTQTILDRSGVIPSDPNQALNPGVIYAPANPAFSTALQTAGVPNPGVLPAVLPGVLSRDDGSRTVTDAAGNISLQDVRLPGGGFQYIDNDFAGLQPWTSKVSIATALGVITSTAFTVAAGDVGAITGTAGITDTINASITTTAGTNIDNLTLTGTAAINGTGNALDNVITGNAAANILDGGAGNDTLDGGVGADNMIGGDGNDTYVVDNAADITTETNALAAGGIDLVQSSVTWTLGANIENLTLTGAGVIDGNGNALANVINGNAAANIISGLAGNDTLNGDAGNDSIDGGTGNDTIDGGVGTDTLLFSGARANYTFLYIDSTHTRITDARVGGDGVDVVTGIESVHFTDGTFLLSALVPPPVATIINGTAANNTLTGTAGNDTISGLAGDDTINGGAGNDRIIGGAGVDTMTGGLGADTFVFADGDLVAGGTGGLDVFYTTPDVITDFSGSNSAYAGGAQLDKIDLSAMDANTEIAGNQAFTIFTPSGFDFTAPAGSIKIVDVPGVGVNPHYDIYINTDSDSAWEGRISVYGIPPVAADFIL